MLSSLGFYPVAPGTGEYILGSPQFKKAKIHLENGKTVEINAPSNSDENIYVNALAIDKTPTDKTYITHEQLWEGPVLDFDMSSTPNKLRGTAPESRPYSFSRTAEGVKAKAANEKRAKAVEKQQAKAAKAKK